MEQLADTKARELRGVLMLEVVDNRVRSRWDIDKMSFDSGRWVAYDAVHRSFTEAEHLATRHHERTELQLKERPRDFLRSVGAPHRQRFAELSDTIQSFLSQRY